MRTLGLAFLLLLASIPTVLAQQQQFRVTSEVVNVRLAPTTTSAVVAKVRAGDILSVVKDAGDWVEVQLPAQDGLRREGYIYKRLGALEAAPAPALTQAPQPTDAASAEPPAMEAPKVKSVAPSDNGLRGLAGSPSSPAITKTINAQIERQRWAMQLANAHEEVKIGRNLMIAGAGLFGVALVLNAGQTKYIGAELAIPFGLGIAGYGAFRFVRGRGQVENLQQEAKAKGFSASITRQGAAITYTWAF